VGARLPWRFADSARLSWDLLSWLRVFGVLEETRLLGRQYEPVVPQGSPDFSFHFSEAHRFRDAPSDDLRLCPFFFRHLAIACEARAEGNLAYRAFTLR